MKKLVILIAAIMILGTTTQAKSRVLIHWDNSGHIYVNDGRRDLTGWFRISGKLCYGYKESHADTPKGSLATNTYRIKGGKLYYLGDDGRQVKTETRYITFNKDGSVHYIYSPGMIRRYRYNANHQRYQYLTDSGRWRDTGMQCWPEGMVDQKR